MDILEEDGEFSRIGELLYFVETNRGNWIWDAVEETLCACPESYYQYLFKHRIGHAKYRGKRKLKDFCGDKVTIRS